MTAVGTAFLKEVDDWWHQLACDLAQNNAPQSARAVHNSTRSVILGLLFLKLSEQQGLEPPGGLVTLLDQEYGSLRLVELLHHADSSYHTEVSRFFVPLEGIASETERELPLVIDDGILRQIVRRLHDVENEQILSACGVDVLGRVYERSLGKSLGQSGAGQAAVKRRPGRRRDRGVYYTPRYVVDYVVRSVLGKLLGGRAPGHVEEESRSSLSVLDLACGCGSFLLGAYEYLLDWHVNWYCEDDPEKWLRQQNPPICAASCETQLSNRASVDAPRSKDDLRPVWPATCRRYRLTAAERIRILTTHIYGIDIDPNAVEIAKRSLLLKSLENTAQHADEPDGSAMERELPDLAANIKCGNALLSTVSGRTRERTLFDTTESSSTNLFDWNAQFPQIMNAGGFDAVIGNPPYRRELDHKGLMDQIAHTPFGRKYHAPRMDLWYYFVHRGLELLKPSGLLSFIVSAYWTSGAGARKLIRTLKDEARIDEMFLLEKLNVFAHVAGRHMILRVSNTPSSSPTTVKVVEPHSETDAEPFLAGQAPVHVFQKTKQQLFQNGKVDLQPPADDLLAKLEVWDPLGKLGHVRQGIAENPAAVTRKANDRFGQLWQVGQGVFALTRQELAQLQLPEPERRLLRPYYDLCDLGRYRIAHSPSLTLVYSTRKTCPDIAQFPALRKHLETFRPIMEARRETRKGLNCWWHLHWPRDERLWESDKIISLQMASRPSFVPVSRPAYVSFSTNIFVPDRSVTKEHLNYVTAILNSRLLWKWYQHHAKRRGKGLELNGNVLSRSPIRRIDFSLERDREIHDELVTLVERIMTLQERRFANENSTQADSIDEAIDELVYELYGLTDEEIVDVEGSRPH